MDWDPTIPGQTVAYRDNPGRIGKTTGKTMGEGPLLKVQVDFGPNSVVFKRYDVLKLIDTRKGIEDKFFDRDFGTPDDLRRILIFEKMKGRLTNVFYSMEIGNTDFYPHQFKPVLKFIESVQGRMLIADEVGLGKTVEAVYIWKELQAREDARRMLVVCPAMLRYKWQSDMYNLFGIEAEIKTASEISGDLDRLSAKRDRNRSFVYITSLEGLRPPAWYQDDPASMKSRVRIANILEASSQDPDFDILDLVIVDEAHYMRNPETANFRLGRLLREASRSLLLLTATPVQTASKNLFQLLQLIDPDTFSSEYIFDLLMDYNRPLTQTMNALCKTPTDIDEVLVHLQELVEKHGYGEDRSIIEMSLRLHEGGNKISVNELSEFARIIESRSLLSNFMSRTRKRDVMENRVIRSPEVIDVVYSEYERKVYKELSKRVLEAAELNTSIAHLVLISRQRQMASCLPAALKAWQDNTYLEDLESCLWEDLGVSTEDEDEDEEFESPHFESAGDFLEIDIDRLQREDSKYGSLKESLRKMLAKNPEEKCVIFAFFTGTLKYLGKRFNEDGITAEMIIGGMKPSEKQSVLETFADAGGFQVLLSSEVGSEGIDLQFCRYLVNYDLPWNPMRVEQRIGRLDRLGQKANRITILNLASFNTIEERILLRLYERIDLFRESIGDLEEILGPVTRELLDCAFNPELNEEEKEQKALEAIRALENQRQQQKEIEDNAINLVGFTDYIYNTIQDVRNKHRWVRSEDLIIFVTDFFANRYPETVLRNLESKECDFIISLSVEARISLAEYIRREKPQAGTKLHSLDSVRCTFDQKIRQLRGRERIDIIHPLIQWIREEYTLDYRLMHGVSAIGISSDQAGIDDGLYVYLVQRWTFRGIKEQEQLVFLAARVGVMEPLDTDRSEVIVQAAAADGSRVTNARNVIPDGGLLENAFCLCMERLNKDYDALYNEKQVENYRLCDNQITSAEHYMNRRIATQEELISRYRENPQDIKRYNMVKPAQGKIDKEKRLFELKRTRIMEKRELDDELQEVAAGVIVVK